MRRLIGLGLILGLFWLMVEIALWLFAPTPQYPIYRYSLRNSYPGLPAQSLFEIDSREVRTLEGVKGRAKQVRLLALGEGLTYQPMQNAPETWWGQTKERLENQLTDTAVSFSVKTSSTIPSEKGPVPPVRDGLRWTRRYLSSVRPNLVIVGYGLAEIMDLGSSYRYDPMALDVASIPSSPLKESLMAASQIARRMRRWRSMRSNEFYQRQTMLGKDNVLVDQFILRRTNYLALQEDSPPAREGNSDPMQEYLEGLKRIRAEIIKAGAKMLVVGEPTLYSALAIGNEGERIVSPRWERFPGPDGKGGLAARPNPAWVHSELERFHKAAESWCKSEGITFVPLNENHMVEKSLDNFFDDVTLTNAGAVQLAEKMTPILEKELAKQ